MSRFALFSKQISRVPFRKIIFLGFSAALLVSTLTGCTHLWWRASQETSIEKPAKTKRLAKAEEDRNGTKRASADARGASSKKFRKAEAQEEGRQEEGSRAADRARMVAEEELRQREAAAEAERRLVKETAQRREAEMNRPKTVRAGEKPALSVKAEEASRKIQEILLGKRKLEAEELRTGDEAKRRADEEARRRADEADTRRMAEGGSRRRGITAAEEEPRRKGEIERPSLFPIETETKRLEEARLAEAKKAADRTAKETKAKEDVAATIRVFFGSDRNRTGTDQPENFYGYQRAAPSYGHSDVTIPHNHKMGNLESPLNLVVWKATPDPKWHIVVANISSLEANDFFARLREATTAQQGARQAFVFVHGYATTFYDALRRAAQMKYDLQFPGTAILYSWPSTGDETTYGADEDSIAWSATNLRVFLSDIAEKSGADEIFLIGHSMGTRGLSSAISAIAANADRNVSSRYKQLILAAPDIDRDIFKDQIFPAIRTAGMALTVYASDRDKALDLSKIGHSYPRLGSTSPTPFIAEGLVTIDASGVDTSFWGHSYYAENRSIISDMYYLIRNTPLAQRFGLQSVPGPNGQYWKFKQ